MALQRTPLQLAHVDPKSAGARVFLCHGSEFRAGGPGKSGGVPPSVASGQDGMATGYACSVCALSCEGDAAIGAKAA